MAYSSKCPNPECSSSSFECEIETPRNSNFKLQFIRCSSCGTVVGTQDYYNIGFIVQKIARKLGVNLG
ncbi:hypothetical protein [Polaribacter sp. Asnod1-A03]|uniref:hypothetical protein n=1 Tax=Polaribacter sp. Asnod1-A03 TaxID=3160581 RepID=UPI0038630782